MYPLYLIGSQHANRWVERIDESAILHGRVRNLGPLAPFADDCPTLTLGHQFHGISLSPPGIDLPRQSSPDISLVALVPKVRGGFTVTPQFLTESEVARCRGKTSSHFKSNGVLRTSKELKEMPAHDSDKPRI
jgi:hypothetical protein